MHDDNDGDKYDENYDDDKEDGFERENIKFRFWNEMQLEIILR